MMIIFVCTSNTCRSPIAEKFGNIWLNNNSIKGIAISRALSNQYEPPGSPASLYGIEILSKEYSIDLKAHRSAMLTAEEVESATYIIGVTKSHTNMINQKFPNSIGKVYNLRDDVQDPWHQSIDVYTECVYKMKPSIELILAELLL